MAESDLEKIKQHPLWSEYEETQDIMKNLRYEAESGDQILGERVEILEDRLTDLTEQIGKDVEIIDPRRNDPLWKSWDEKWQDLRKARREGKTEEEETVWADLFSLAAKIDIRESFSKN